jgi:predicted permease
MGWLKQLFTRRRRYDELSESIREHLDEKIADLMDRGMTQDQAVATARREFGDVTRIEERSREVWQWPKLESVWADLIYALRRLRKSPGFTITAILMLAFGLGATTAVFSIMDGVLLQPLPFPDPSRLVILGDQLNALHSGEGYPGWATPNEVVVYPRDTRSFQSLGGFGFEGYELSGVGRPARIVAARMTPSVFSVLGVAPLMGRVFTPEEDTQRAQVMVLSYFAWKSRLNGNPKVIGTVIDLDRKPYTVIGVMPRDFAFPLVVSRFGPCELWVPMSFRAQELTPDQGWSLQMVGRLKPGVTVAQAQDDARSVAAQIMRNYPPDMSNFRIRPVVYPLHENTVVQTRPLLRMLFLAVAVVLLIACANFAGLLLVRAIRRQRETAVRLALGAPARTLLQQTIAESLVLSVAGGLIGIGLAAFAIYGGRNLLPANLPLTSQITLNWTVAGFGLLLALLTGGLCGLAPGFAALRTNVNASLKEGGRSGLAGGTHARFRSALVVAEIAIALVLLCASGLLLRSYMKLSEMDLGFEPGHTTTAAYALPQKEYPTQERVDAFNNQVLLRLSQVPGVQSVGLTDTLPTRGGVNGVFVADGYVDPRGLGQTAAAASNVVGDFFRTMGIPLIRGRYFSDSDNVNGQLVVIVNHEFAEHYWPNQNPIGKRLRQGTPKSTTPWMTVVGEVADAKLNQPDADTAEQFYTPVAQIEKAAGSYAMPTDLNGSWGYIVVRSELPPEQMENAVRAVVRSIDPQLPLTQVKTMDEVVAASEAPRRFNATIISTFALAAVLLAVLGIYSVITFSVASRVQEMAIRMALGSQRSHIVRLIFASGLKLAAVGCILGLAGAAAAASMLRSFLFQVSPFDPAVMALTAASVFLLAFAASVIPALRAASVDPMQALRSE